MPRASAGIEQSVQTFGRKKSAIAVSYCKKGRGQIRVNGCPIELVQPELLRFKVFEPILLLGKERFSIMDLRIRVKGGGYTSQIYAIRQAIAKSIVAYYQKCASTTILRAQLPPAPTCVARAVCQRMTRQEQHWLPLMCCCCCCCADAAAAFGVVAPSAHR